MTETTTNFGFELPDFNVATWHDAVNGNFSSIDTLLSATTGLTGIKGAWANSTTYVVDDRVIDNDDGTLWICKVGHTSAALGTFEEDRILHPTYWEGMGSGWTARGAWLNNTTYKIGDTAYDASDYLYCVCIDPHVSNMAGDLRDDLVRWVILMDGLLTVSDAQAARDAAQLAQAAAEAAQLAAEDAEADTVAVATPLTTLYSNFAGGAAGQVLIKDTATDYDFSWAALPGGGDMLKSIYDPTNISASAFDRANHTGSQAISTITGLQTLLDSYALETRTLTAGVGLSGGGDLTANRTFDVDYGTIAGTATQGNDTRVVNAVQTSRTISAGAGLSGGGSLAADRTISHGDTSSQGSANNTGANFIQGITLDTYGHITALDSSNILTQMGASVSAGGVGSYALAVRTGGSAAYDFGDTIAGSNLTTSNAGGGTVGGVTLSGTWRCMGELASGSNEAIVWFRTV